MSIEVDLNGKIAVVTGSGRGIGRAIALALGNNGATVITTARSQTQITAVAEEIKQAGGSSKAFRCDISDGTQITNLFSYIQKEFGRLDILVNNAAIGLYGPMQDFNSDDLDKLLAVNVRGTYLCCQEALRMMIPRNTGTIINISSVVGFKGYENQSAYAASKHAVVGMTKSLAVEAQKHHIRASLIHPGGVDTDLVGAARPDLDRSVLMQPEDIAHTVLYLLSLSERCAVDEIYIRRRTSSPF
jgi:3-oxoacyl-[acyl-carrier protein] reductase